MTDIITTVLKIFISPAAKILRIYGAKKLENCGYFGQVFRDTIPTDADAIKLRLDGLSQADLESSITYLELGIDKMKISFEDCFEEGDSLGVEQVVELAEAIGKMKIKWKERFASAKEEIKNAADQARGVFLYVSQVEF